MEFALDKNDNRVYAYDADKSESYRCLCCDEEVDYIFT